VSRLALRGLFWKLRTAAQKRWIGFQERFGRFGYADWIQQNESPGVVSGRPPGVQTRPFLSLLIVVDPGNLSFLRRTWQSLTLQDYTGWDACLLLDGLESAAVEWLAGDHRLQVCRAGPQIGALQDG
jgi:hypothetical protein